MVLGLAIRIIVHLICCDASVTKICHKRQNCFGFYTSIVAISWSHYRDYNMEEWQAVDIFTASENKVSEKNIFSLYHCSCLHGQILLTSQEAFISKMRFTKFKVQVNNLEEF